MNNFLKNVLLLVAVLALSYFTAGHFGFLYDYFTPGTLGSRALAGTPEAWQSLIGLPFAFIFFLILLFKLFAAGNKNGWIGWLLVPPFLFFVAGDLVHIYLPIILTIIAFGTATLLRRVLPENN